MTIGTKPNKKRYNIDCYITYLKVLFVIEEANRNAITLSIFM